MTDIPKIVPINLAASLKAASQSHYDLKEVIAEHAKAAEESRVATHDRLAAENMLTDALPKAVT